MDPAAATRRRRHPAAAWAAAAATALAVPSRGFSPAQDKPTEITTTCVTSACHAGLAARPVQHRPSANGQCLECHEPAVPKQHLFRLSAPRRDLCAKCHAIEGGPNVHAPVAAGDCTGCHDPHGADRKALLVADPGRDLCARCHDAATFDKPFVHGPVAIGACTVCHQPHASSYPALLVKDARSLCTDCHAEIAPSGPAARHQHRPMRDGCTTCHDPHASDVRYQLRQAVPDLCFTCHSGIANLLDSAPVVHQVAREPQGCVECHTPHFSQLPSLQRRPQPDLCLTCHDRPLPAPDGSTLTNMARLLADNPDHHGPIRAGSCTACHQPHAADHFRLLLEEYPPDFYAPFDVKRYALCFSCHLPDMVKDPSGTGLTNFRDGDRNLHWLHVNQEKGRTCRACHEVHASTHPFHIRDAVPFGSGGWLLQINYRRDLDGGTCTPACHKTRSYRRGSAPPAAPAPVGGP